MKLSQTSIRVISPTHDCGIDDVTGLNIIAQTPATDRK